MILVRPTGPWDAHKYLRQLNEVQGTSAESFKQSWK